MAAGEFIEVLSSSALTDLDALNAKLVDTVKYVGEVNKLMGTIKTPSGSKGAIDDLNAKIAKQQALFVKLEIEIEKHTLALTKTRIEEEKLVQAKMRTEAAINRSNAALNKEVQKLQQAGNLYNKIQKELNEMSNEFKHLATMKEMDISLTDSQLKRYTFLEREIKKYDTTLKAVDASMGKYTRNVGNYASGFNPLSNSINQLTREAPAFVNSLQTGFMALSNNIPIFFDAMKQANAQVKLLQEQGKPTVSMLSQISAALFSWQTLLSVGVTLLTVYGDELINWTMEIINGEKALETATKSLERFHEAQREGAVSAANEKAKYEELIAILSDPSIDPEKRKIALDELVGSHEKLLHGLTLQQAMNFKSLPVYKEILRILEAKEQYDKSTAATDKLRDELSLVKDELNFRKEEKEAVDKLREAGEKFRNINIITHREEKEAAKEALVAQGKIVKGLKEARERRKEDTKTAEFASASLTNLMATEISLTEQKNIAVQRNEILKEKSLEGTYKEAKAIGTKNEKSIKEIDFEKEKIKLVYDLLIAQKEKERMPSEAILKDEKATFDERINARMEFSVKSKEILLLQYQKESALADEHFDSEMKKNDENYKKALKNNADNVKAGLAKDQKTEIDKRHLDNREAILKSSLNQQAIYEIDYSKKWRLLTEDDTKFFADTERQRAKIAQEASNIVFDIETQRIKKESENQRHRLKQREADFQDFKNRALSILEFNYLIARSDEQDPTKRALIDANYEKDVAAIKNIKGELEKVKEATNLWQDSFASGFFSDAGFPTLFKLLNEDITGFGENAQVTFLAVSQMAQESFQFITELEERKTKKALQELEHQKEMAEKFSGDSEAAKEKLEREYEQRRQAILLRQFKQKQKMAMINITIDTSQAIMGALGQDPTPAGIAMAIAIGVLGAIQLAMVASQKPPEFWSGTDNAPEGWAKTDERGAEIHTDKHGKIKDFGSGKGARYKYLKSGDKIYNALESKKILEQDENNAYLNRILASNGIDRPIVVNNGITASEMDKMLEKHIASQPQIINRWDEHGFGSYVSKNGNITRRAENRGSGKGITL